PTVRRKPLKSAAKPLSSLRKQGPIPRNLSVWLDAGRPSSQRRPVVMGPGSRFAWPGRQISVLDPVAVQIVAVSVEPALGALDRGTDARHHAQEPRRMVHLDQMSDLMGGEIIEHERRRQDQPP